MIRPPSSRLPADYGECHSRDCLYCTDCTVVFPRIQDNRFRLEWTCSFSVLCHGTSKQTPTKANPNQEKFKCHGLKMNALSKGSRGDGSERAGIRGLEDSATSEGTPEASAGVVCVEVVCPYTRSLVAEGFARRRAAWRVTKERSVSRNGGEITMGRGKRGQGGGRRLIMPCGVKLNNWGMGYE